MSEITDDYVEYITPGQRIVFYAEQDSNIVVYGMDGDFVFRGYQVIGTETFWVVDHVKGVGKKARFTRMTFNGSKIERARVINMDH